MFSCFLLKELVKTGRRIKLVIPMTNISGIWFQGQLSFGGVDKMIGQSDWYKNDRGYKAQTVTYTIAWLVNWVRQSGRNFDLQRIWNDQNVPSGVQRRWYELPPLSQRKYEMLLQN